MKTIEEVKQFITDFIAWEYKVKRSSLDLVTSKEQHFEDARLYLERFYSILLIPTQSSGLTTKPVGVDPEILKKNYDRVQKRTLYIIRQYENTQFGKGIRADDNTFYSCILGPNTNLDEIEIYDTNLCVATVDGNLKIIAIRKQTKEFDAHGRIKWTVNQPSAITEGNTILDEGNQIAALRIAKPEFEKSLTDYNID